MWKRNSCLRRMVRKNWEEWASFIRLTDWCTSYRPTAHPHCVLRLICITRTEQTTQHHGKCMHNEHSDSRLRQLEYDSGWARNELTHFSTMVTVNKYGVLFESNCLYIFMAILPTSALAIITPCILHTYCNGIQSVSVRQLVSLFRLQPDAFGRQLIQFFSCCAQCGQNRRHALKPTPNRRFISHRFVTSHKLIQTKRVWNMCIVHVVVIRSRFKATFLVCISMYWRDPFTIDVKPRLRFDGMCHVFCLGSTRLVRCRAISRALLLEREIGKREFSLEAMFRLHSELPRKTRVTSVFCSSHNWGVCYFMPHPIRFIVTIKNEYEISSTFVDVLQIGKKDGKVKLEPLCWYAWKTKTEKLIVVFF